ncbi:MAG: uracil-DNA glycosylase family protein [Burkholderiaceae bacterium]|nr:uracil-DNA glycosylase family protein [Burkholderiaceae bacterium]
MMKNESLLALRERIAACRICAEHLPLGPRPVVRFSATAGLVIVGQAPGTKVHESGVPWSDNSGARLREWLGMTEQEFYDVSKVALVPMGFCYPGKGKSGDLPPRKECAPQWHEAILERLHRQRLTLLVGSYAQQYYLRDDARNMTDRVQAFRDYLPRYLPLPHPSWRSTKWIKDNPWFETEVLPVLKAEVAKRLK